MREHVCKICGRLYAVDRWDMRSSTCSSPECKKIYHQQRKEEARQRAKLEKERTERTRIVVGNLDEKVRMATAAGMSYGYYVAQSNKKSPMSEPKENISTAHAGAREVKSIHHQYNFDFIFY